jgi:tRNA nucleotidyltransferase (CCA-adding enzyme)
MIDTTNIINKVPSQVLSVLRHIQGEGYSAYLVGGSVRDILLNREPHDYDVCTNAPLEVLQSLWLDCKVVGAAFGVVLVKVDGLEIQIARFRTEQGYSDYRHPDTVLFADNIKEDLSRRDFTINTFAMNSRGGLTYIVGAMEDLNNKIISTVGNPEERFNEDGLRMIRAVRFHCQLNCAIEPNISLAISKNSQLIKKISMERIQEELNKILLSDCPNEGIILLSGLNLLSYIIPELNNCRSCGQNNYHKWDVFDHICKVLKLVHDDLSMRLTALFHDIGKPIVKTTTEDGNVHFYGHDEVSANMAKEIMTRLKYDNQMIDEVTYLVRYHMELMNAPFNSNKAIRKLLNRHGESRLRKLIEFRRADLLGSGTRDSEDVENLIKEYRYRLDKVLEEKPPTQLVNLAIDGNEIMEITGLKPGIMIGRIKNKLMELVIENPELNTEEQLSPLAREAMVDSFIDWTKE